jgi:hypothetical protein
LSRYVHHDDPDDSEDADDFRLLLKSDPADDPADDEAVEDELRLEAVDPLLVRTLPRNRLTLCTMLSTLPRRSRPYVPSSRSQSESSSGSHSERVTCESRRSGCGKGW